MSDPPEGGGPSRRTRDIIEDWLAAILFPLFILVIFIYSWIRSKRE